MRKIEISKIKVRPFGEMSKEGYWHIFWLTFSFGSDGFQLSILGLTIVVKITKEP